MWLVKKAGTDDGLLCRSLVALESARQFYSSRGIDYTVEETWTVQINDPQEQ